MASGFFRKTAGRTVIFQADASPVHHRIPVECHEENLAAASRTHRCKEHLKGEKDRNDHTVKIKMNPYWSGI